MRGCGLQPYTDDAMTAQSYHRACAMAAVSLRAVMLMVVLSSFLLCMAALSAKSFQSTAGSLVAPDEFVRPHSLSKPGFTTHTCIGGHGRAHNWRTTTCLFTDVCYNSADATFEYVVPAHEHAAFLFPGQSPDKIELVSLNYVMLDTREKVVQPLRLRLKVATVPLPYDYTSDVAVLHQPYSPQNFGHLLNDDLFPIYTALEMFGYNFSQCRLVFTEDCDNNWLYPQNEYFAGACRALQQKWLPALKSPKQYLPQMNNTCFKHMIVGLHSLAWSSSPYLLGRGFVFQHMIDELVAIKGQPLTAPIKQKVVIIKKLPSAGSSRRAILNADELVTALSVAFPAVEVTGVFVANLSATDEIELMRSATVVITGDGGGAWGTVFVSSGTTVVYLDFYNFKDGASVAVELAWWSFLPHLRTVQYEVLPSEIVPNYEGAGSLLQWRNMVDYRLSVERVTRVVREGLYHAGVRHGLVGSYNYTMH